MKFIAKIFGWMFTNLMLMFLLSLGYGYAQIGFSYDTEGNATFEGSVASRVYPSTGNPWCLDIFLLYSSTSIESGTLFKLPPIIDFAYCLVDIQARGFGPHYDLYATAYGLGEILRFMGEQKRIRFKSRFSASPPFVWLFDDLETESGAATLSGGCASGGGGSGHVRFWINQTAPVAMVGAITGISESSSGNSHGCDGMVSIIIKDCENPGNIVCSWTSGLREFPPDDFILIRQTCLLETGCYDLIIVYHCGGSLTKDCIGDCIDSGAWAFGFVFRLLYGLSTERMNELFPEESNGEEDDADVNGDGCVDEDDLLAVLFAYGQNCNCAEDTNADGEVNDIDLQAVLFNFGFGCEE